MIKIREFLKNIFTPRLKDQVSSDELKTLFQSRYHSFKLLLAANNKALEIMSEMEEGISGSRLFDKSFIKSRTTSILVNVYKIIKNLDNLAPDKYKELYKIFQKIKDEIDSIIVKSGKISFVGAIHELPLQEKLILPFEEIDDSMSSLTGTKMAALGSILKNTPYKVPKGFVITAKASQMFFRFQDLHAEIERRIQSNQSKGSQIFYMGGKESPIPPSQKIDALFKLSSDIQQLIIKSPIPIEIEEEIKRAYSKLEREIDKGKDLYVSLRSSAIGEDSLGASFAGQYSSRLNVPAHSILEAYKEILASIYNLTAITYRLNKGIVDEDALMCVGCMAMVDAVCGGVVYTGNPLSLNDNSLIINSVWGLPKSVVDGSAASDNFVVDRNSLTISKKDIANKTNKLVLVSEGGIFKEELPSEYADRQSLSDLLIIEISKIALDLERYYGYPVDIEWAIDPNDNIYILQCRPLQKLGHQSYKIDEDSPEEKDALIFKGGITVSQGIASGTVHIVEKDADMLSFPDKNGILVVRQSLPRWAALLGRSCGVIAGQGGIVGHLATVSRELNKPAIFNAQDITNILSTGDVITMDAGKRSIYKGRMESIFKRYSSNIDDKPLHGSPAHSLLKEVSKKITPLNLLDPDSIDFIPDNCQTLHDITRYCHEKSVKEMFDFGKSHHFSERASKQLMYNVPLKWWIINLDDGFLEDVKGKYVKIENIVSIPMLALWEGIMAIPWSGPPSIDAKGFISIIHQATINPDLSPSMYSQYSNKNYFLISRNFCSLMSRFGFHYATVETMLSERISENYAGFNFKGGAADLERRIKRARFLASLLEEYGFYVRLREDSLSARVEAIAEGEMIKKLKILGYLLMHTRQLDMIMSNIGLVESYRTKMQDELNSIIGL